MSIPFSKMQGLGNDFVVLDNRSGQVAHLEKAEFRRLADRHLGIGCDQILIIEQGASGPAYRVLNADGSEVGQCGNGARCVARWLFDQGAIGNTATVGSPAGPVGVNIGAGTHVEVDMGVPVFEPPRIPLLSDQPGPRHEVQVGGEHLQLLAVSLGNPHAVLRVEDLSSAPVQELGQALQSHPQFPERVNVGFAQILRENAIALRVYERGVGETQACGTGACAAVVGLSAAGALRASRVAVQLPGGTLAISWPGGAAQVKMAGPAEYVFSGTFEPH